MTINRKPSTINECWEQIFHKYKIAEQVQSHGMFRISAKQIKEYKEPRLMAKFDQYQQLPPVFKANQLSILPITRGDYMIAPMNTHAKLSYSEQKPSIVSIPNLETIDATNLYSEAAALLFAYNSGIFQDAFETTQIRFTVNGRMSSGSFDFNIQHSVRPSENVPVSVNNAQVEIDAGYESADSFFIVEAKNIAVEDILIRQLYYPYRLWSRKISKPVYPVFLVYSNDIFRISVFRFSCETDYHSLELVKTRCYAFAHEAITNQDILQLLERVSPRTGISITFPQADSFERVIDLLSLLHERELSKDEVTVNYGFDERQTNYYTDACRYLGLVDKEKTQNSIMFRLSADALKIMVKSKKQKTLEYIRCILQTPVFFELFRSYIIPSVLAHQKWQVPEKSDIVRVMKNCGLPYGDVTLERRALTVRSWLQWIFEQIETL